MMSGNSEIWLLTVDQEAEEDNTANGAGASHITKGSWTETASSFNQKSGPSGNLWW